MVMASGFIAAQPAAGAVPDGWSTVAESSPVDGVTHAELRSAAGAPQRVHVARIGPDADVELRALSAGEPGEAPTRARTSTMCQRVSCIVAVNADFFDLRSGTPLGAVVENGTIGRSPVPGRPQVIVGDDGAMRFDQGFAWSGVLSTTDLKTTAIHGVNVYRPPDQAVLYTRYGGTDTGTAADGAELVLRFAEGGAAFADGPAFGQSALVELVELRDPAGSTPIPPNGAVLSAGGAAADQLRDLWARVQAKKAGNHALLRIEGNVRDSVGGGSVLVQDGVAVFEDQPNSFVRGRHPRTAIGWTSAGEVLMVTVDGRQPGYSDGMTLRELSDLLIGLGATSAVNLDGGGSTAFVVNGTVANRPSDQLVQRSGSQRLVSAARSGDRVVGNVERPVANAFAVVPKGAAPAPTRSPDPLAALVEQAVAEDAQTLTDPASAPQLDLPSLALPPADRTPPARASSIRFVEIGADGWDVDPLTGGATLFAVGMLLLVGGLHLGRYLSSRWPPATAVASPRPGRRGRLSLGPARPLRTLRRRVRRRPLRRQPPHPN